MTNEKTFNEQIQAMATIGNIQALCRVIGRKPLSFDMLDSTPNQGLERIRDSLIVEYNARIQIEQRR